MDVSSIRTDTRRYGEIIETNKCGKCRIVGFNYTQSGNQVFICEFEDGNLVGASSSQIREREILNPYAPILHGVGYSGEYGKCKTKEDKLIRKRWQGMISRCYNKKDKLYKRYGNKGVIVCERWHNFTNYINDFSNILGYDEYLKYGHVTSFHVDKDILGDSLEYSLEKTCLVPNALNGFFADKDWLNKSGTSGITRYEDKGIWLAGNKHKKYLTAKNFKDKSMAIKYVSELQRESLKDFLINDFYWLNEIIKLKCFEKLEDKIRKYT